LVTNTSSRVVSALHITEHCQATPLCGHIIGSCHSLSTKSSTTGDPCTVPERPATGGGGIELIAKQVARAAWLWNFIDRRVRD